jgi:hypothetical protein
MKFGENVFLLGIQGVWPQSDQQAALLPFAAYGGRQRSGVVHNRIFGPRFGRITRVSVAPESRPSNLKTFLDRYHGEKHLIQKAGPQARVPLTRKHGGN